MNSGALYGKWFVALGGINAVIAVGLGAAAAHVFKGHLMATNGAEIFQTALQFHLFHALGLIVVGLVALRYSRSTWFAWSGGLMLAGIFLFSVNLYLRCLIDFNVGHATVPLGGICFMLAWLIFTLGACQIQAG